MAASVQKVPVLTDTVIPLAFVFVSVLAKVTYSKNLVLHPGC